METLEQQILETWRINHRTNLLLIERLTEEPLNWTTSPRGGGKIGHQLAHLYNVRFWKMERFDKSVLQDMLTVKASDEKSLNLLRDLHELSAEWIEQLIIQSLEQDGKVKGWKRGLVPLIGYFIHHEAHHRGNILLTLKRHKFKFPDELKYGIWDWNKI